MPEFTIRPATLADAPAMPAVHCSTQEVWRDPVMRQPTTYATLDAFGRWYNGGAWMDADLCAAHLARLLADGHLPLVAESAGRICGEAEYYLDREPPPYGPHLHLSILYVHREFQRQGIGAALLQAGGDYAARLGMAGITTQPETGALGFYTRCGYRPWMLLKEMQSPVGRNALLLPEVTPWPPGAPLPGELALRIGRYQCGAQGWEGLWPTLPLPRWQNLRRGVWAWECTGQRAVLGLREQLSDPTQADGFAWLSADALLAPAIEALRALAAGWGLAAVDVLLPADAVAALRTTLRLDYQASLALWGLFWG